MFCEDAWCEHPELLIVAPATATDLRAAAERCCPEGTVRFLDRLDANVERMNIIYQECHLVCQPSRGEGFGMVPLEARAAGVPVLMTTCTGHAEHAGPRSHPDDRLGVIEVDTGELAPIDDGPGALAPSLDVKTLYVALVGARADWLAYKQDTVQAAAGLSERWSWRRVTEEWLRGIGLSAGGGEDGTSEDRGSG
jgi:glycosyltransferase involved in cell wall biosynthesis